MDLIRLSTQNVPEFEIKTSSNMIQVGENFCSEQVKHTIFIGSHMFRIRKATNNTFLFICSTFESINGPSSAWVWRNTRTRLGLETFWSGNTGLVSVSFNLEIRSRPGLANFSEVVSVSLGLGKTRLAFWSLQILCPMELSDLFYKYIFNCVIGWKKFHFFSFIVLSNYIHVHHSVME